MATYVRVVEAGSFSAAAKQLRDLVRRGQPPDRDAGGGARLKLLRRTTRRMAITPAGERYYQSCLRVLREVDDAQAVGSEEAPGACSR